MSHEERMTAFTTTAPLVSSVEYITVSSQYETADGTAPARSGIYDSQAMIAAKSAVAEYLRDLGVRDPDIIAAESQQIVAQAVCEAPSVSLSEAAIRLTVKRLEHFLTVLAAESGVPGEAMRLNCGLAARLPVLLGDFPQAFSGKHLPAEIVTQLRTGIAPVVPAARPQRMRRQRLTLLPAFVQRVVDFFCGERQEN